MSTPRTHVARPIIVLETYVGQLPAKAGMRMPPLCDELEQRGFVVRPASILKRIGGRTPRPGVLDKDQITAEIAKPADVDHEADTRYCRNAAGAGVVVGSVEGMAIGPGGGLWKARSRRSSAPVFAIGWSGGFTGRAGDL
jgi:hypothetical protein